DTNEHDERNFSRAVVRRLPAEVLLDAVAQATADTGGLIASASEVESRAFGPRGTMSYNRAGAGYADRVFGRSARDTNCDCGRSDEPNLLQAVYLQHDGDVLSRLERRDGWVAEVRSGGKGGSGPAGP